MPWSSLKPLLFDSVEHMLSPQGLSSFLGGSVEVVERRPLEVEHFSGNRLERLHVLHNGHAVDFVLKHFSLEHDWVMRLTNDHAVREVALYREGMYQRMPVTCYVPIVAAARNRDMWTSMMVDISAGLIPSGPIPFQSLEWVLAHLAAVHAQFLGSDLLRRPALGLSSLRDFVLILSPDSVRNELADGQDHPVLRAAAEGWTIFADVAPPAAVRMLTRLQNNVQPLLDRLSSLSQTLVHGDFKLANLGSLATAGQQRTIMLDWQDATYGPPLMDLGYLLAIDAARLPASREAALEIYRDGLMAAGVVYTNEIWQREVEVGLLAGGAMRVLWQKALRTQSTDPVLRKQAHADLEWWSELVVRAKRWLE